MDNDSTKIRRFTASVDASHARTGASAPRAIRVMRRRSRMSSSLVLHEDRGGKCDDERYGPQHPHHAPRLPSAAKVLGGLGYELFDLSHWILLFRWFENRCQLLMVLIDALSPAGGALCV